MEQELPPPSEHYIYSNRFECGTNLSAQIKFLDPNTFRIQLISVVT